MMPLFMPAIVLLKEVGFVEMCICVGRAHVLLDLRYTNQKIPSDKERAPPKEAISAREFVASKKVCTDSMLSLSHMS
jgi:hypothetical protein